MTEHELGISDRSKNLCRRLLEKKHAPLENTIFCDETFDEAMCVIWVGKGGPVLAPLGPKLGTRPSPSKVDKNDIIG